MAPSEPLRSDRVLGHYGITVSEGISNRAQLAVTMSNGQTGEQGWRIGNDRLYRSSDSENWTNTESALVIAIKGTAGIIASTDAKLSDLTLADGDGTAISLTPTFVSATTSYTASVANRIDAVTLTATTNDSNAMVAITSDDNTASPGEAELDLIVGSNTLTVTVTAEDTTTMKTYMVTVTREATTNTPATGEPSITGAAQVGKTLEAETSGIMDADGVPASFTYQWLRVDADGVSNETNIGSDASAYTPVAADVGKTIKVAVRFTDDAGTAEGPLESDAYPSAPPGATVVAAQGSCPAGADWCATLTMGYLFTTSLQSDFHEFGFVSGSNFGLLDSAMFTRGSTTYTVTQISRLLLISLDGNTILTDNLSLLVSGGTLPDGTVLNVGGTELTVGTDSATSTDGQEQWNLKALGIAFAWVEGQDVTVSVRLGNTPATGTPEISGTAQVGQELSAAVGTIADPDGLPSTFPDEYTFQWVRVVGGTATDITGATSNTYTPSAADAGNTIKVTVSFTDGAGHAEGPLESDATATIRPADADWCATLTVGIAPGGTDITHIGFGASLGALDDPTIDYGGKTFTVARMLIIDSTFNVIFITLDAFLPRGSVFNLGGTEFTANQASEEVNAGQYSWVPPANFTWLEGQQVTVSVKLDNFAAEGMPEISGTAVVGQELTAAVGTIADPDGLPAGFTYQWVRVDADGSNPTDIGTDSSTYTLVAADEGKKVKVTVRFTDGAGYAEGPLESDATATVVAAAGPCPADNDWCTTLTVGIAPGGTDITHIGFGASLGALDDPTIDYGGKTFTVARMLIIDSTFNVIFITLDAFLPRGSVFNLGGTEFTANQASEEVNAGQYSWVPPANFTWLEGQQVTVSVRLGNFAAEGMPEISGTAVVGQELTAAVGTIADPDGLPSTFPDEYTFQWVRVVGGTATDITGATSNTYTPSAADAGNTIKVTVSFTDGADHAEGPLESDATATVAVAVSGAAGVTVSKTVLTVTEEDATGDSYTVVLDSEPTATVTVTVAGHAGTDVTRTPGTLTFTTSNWDTVQTVTVTAGNDTDTTDDSVTLTHSAASTDTAYSGITIAGVVVTVRDNDTAQVTGVSVTSGNARLVVNWTAVDNATGYTVQWKSGGQGYNTGNRQFTVTSGSTTSHTITGLANGTEYTVRVSATRTGANDGPPSAGVQGTPAVPTAAGVTVSKTALTVTEQDSAGDSYTVVLDIQPTATVTVTVAGHAGTDVTRTPGTLTFTTSNWDTVQTVTVTAGNDTDTTDDSVTLTHSAASTDTAYSGITIAGVVVTVRDNDTAQVTGVSVTSGNARLVVNWTAVGNATGYTVQWKSGNQGYNTGNRQATVTSGTTTSHTITGLTNGTAYMVQVSATRTGANDGPPSAGVTKTPEANAPTDPDPLTLTVEAVDDEVTEGEPVHYRIVMSKPTGGVEVEAVYRYRGEFLRHDPSSTITGIRSRRGVLYWEVERQTLDDAVDEADGRFTVRLRPGDGYQLGTPSVARVTIRDNDPEAVSPPVVSVADATVEEGTGPLAFRVTLDRAPVETATVDWETLNGSAKAGQDYVAASGTLVFAPGETVKTVTVAVLDDVHDEGREVMLLYLPNAVGAIIADAVAKGTISNSDPMPRALMARFGRTAAVHVVEHVEERLAAPREVGVEAQVAGRQLRPGMAREMALDFLSQLGSSAGMHAPGAGSGAARSGSPMGAAAGSIGLAAGMGGPAGGGMGVAADPMNGRASPDGGLFDRGLRSMGLGVEHLLTSSSFALTRETRQGGILSFWSRGARSSFAGREEALSLGGDVRTTMFGADYAKVATGGGPVAVAQPGPERVRRRHRRAGGLVGDRPLPVARLPGHRPGVRVGRDRLRGRRAAADAKRRAGAEERAVDGDGGGRHAGRAGRGRGGRLCAGVQGRCAVGRHVDRRRGRRGGAAGGDRRGGDPLPDGAGGLARLHARRPAVAAAECRSRPAARRRGRRDRRRHGRRRRAGGVGLVDRAGRRPASADAGDAPSRGVPRAGPGAVAQLQPDAVDAAGADGAGGAVVGRAGQERRRGAVGPRDDGGDGARRRRRRHPARRGAGLRAAGRQPLRGDAHGRRRNLRRRAGLPAGLPPRRARRCRDDGRVRCRCAAAGEPPGGRHGSRRARAGHTALVAAAPRHASGAPGACRRTAEETNRRAARCRTTRSAEQRFDGASLRHP